MKKIINIKYLLILTVLFSINSFAGTVQTLTWVTHATKGEKPTDQTVLNLLSEEGLYPIDAAKDEDAIAFYNFYHAPTGMRVFATGTSAPFWVTGGAVYYGLQAPSRLVKRIAGTFKGEVTFFQKDPTNNHLLQYKAYVVKVDNDSPYEITHIRHSDVSAKVDNWNRNYGTK